LAARANAAASAANWPKDRAACSTPTAGPGLTRRIVPCAVPLEATKDWSGMAWGRNVRRRARGDGPVEGLAVAPMVRLETIPTQTEIVADVAFPPRPPTGRGKLPPAIYTVRINGPTGQTIIRTSAELVEELLRLGADLPASAKADPKSWAMMFAIL